MGEGSRLRVVRITTALAFALTLLITPRVWIGHPELGWFTSDGSAPLPVPLLWAIYPLLLLLLVGVQIPRFARVATFAFVVVFLIRASPDPVVWQPYFLQYLSLLAVVACVQIGTAEDRRRAAALDACRLVLVGIYFWAGFAKLHRLFLDERGVPPVRALLEALPEGWQLAATASLPILECLLGIGVLWKRTRPFSLAGILAMHMIILAGIGPWGDNHNRAVWPWNVAMMIYAMVLFTGSETRPRDVLLARRFLPHYAITLLFVVLPGLSYVGLWNPYLSFRLYASRSWNGYVLVTRDVRQRLPVSVENLVENRQVGPFVGYVRLGHWAESEIGVFPPRTPAMYEKIAKRFTRWSRAPGDMVFGLESPPNTFTGERQQEMRPLRR